MPSPSSVRGQNPTVCSCWQTTWAGTIWAALTPTEEVDFDGLSIVPALQGKELDRDSLFWHQPHSFLVEDGLVPASAIRKGDWKLFRCYCDGQDGKDRYELYDLAEDPSEKTNLAGMLFMKSSGKFKMKDLRTATRLLFLCVSMMVGLAVVSCQSPQPKLRTVGYDNPYRPIPIAAGGRAQVHQLIQFFIETNPQIDINRLGKIASAYIDEAAAEGINSDVAFCQMVHETNYLRFSGDMKAGQNNFCGLGATGGGEPGLSFSSVEVGVRAHIQHLKAYANARPLRKKLVDPRFGLVRRARAPYVEDLTGTWAMDAQYGVKLKRKLQALEKHL